MGYSEVHKKLNNGMDYKHVCNVKEKEECDVHATLHEGIWIKEQSKDTNMQKGTKQTKKLKKGKSGDDHQEHLADQMKISSVPALWRGYRKLRLEMAQFEKKLMAEITRSERVLYFLLPGGLVKVRKGGKDWGWSVVVNVVKKPPVALGSLPATLSASCATGNIVDTLLLCSLGSSENGSRPKPCPPPPGEKCEMHVVPIQLPLISSLSKLRISVPSDLRPLEARQSIFLAVQELEKGFPEGLPKLNPVKGDIYLTRVCVRNIASDVYAKTAGQKLEMRLQKFWDELRNRSQVLKNLGHIDADGIVQLKGQATCLIKTGEELLVTKLMFNGTFNDLNHHQVAALASCFIPGDRSEETIQLRDELEKPLQQLQDSARRIAEVS
ncbi:hypothetical protein KY290_010875 [Solanum tuberosum]|uniref:ATP-dependent RNA helicase Ski2/MTR4 C-terminal domain-containing protein n=1 Tax=Solanum tuberosum TaxID=4113 RepID=A0ABQ7VZ08_SOLTU|nr:hypothetical protein KY290_010875 [Solanum tuberosum]